MGFGINYLGQDIWVGDYFGFPTGSCAILENATAFSLISYIFDHMDGFASPTGATKVFMDSSHNLIFGIGYQYTDNNGLRTFIKVANTNDGFLSENETIPTSAPWNGWIMVSGDRAWYNGIDLDNITYDDYFLNSIMFYQNNASLYPYWYGPTAESIDSDRAQGYAPANFIICFGTKDASGTSYVNFEGSTPLLTHAGMLTNWADTNNHTDPSYTLSDIGYGSQYAYNPIHIIGALVTNNSNEDPSNPNSYYGGSYGWRGSSVKFGGPLTNSLIDTGFATLFAPTKAQVRDLANYMWSSDLVDNLKKLWSDPMDSIIAFGLIPLNISGFRENTTSNVIIGNIDTGVDMYKLTQQFVEFDCGAINIRENFNNALDYDPFTTASLYLPYCGFVPLKANDIMASDVHVFYAIDLLSGDCVAHVEVNKYNEFAKIDSEVYQYRGNCMIQLPITGANYANFYKNLVMGPIQSATQAIGGNPVDSIKSGVASCISGVMDGPDISRGGNYGGASAALMTGRPYIILSRPNQQWPEDYNKYVGYPSFVTYKLSDCKGFTMVEGVIDNTVAATDTEKAEIEKILKEGVIL